MFKYIKTKYENIYDWSESGEGTCFYCKQDKDVAIKLIGDKGICKSCLDSFEVGRLSVDRHVLNHIMPEFKNAKEAINWFKKNTPYRYDKKGEVNDWYLYDCVYDEAVYKKHHAQLMSGELVGMTEDFMRMSDRIEFCKDGSVHIIY